MKSQLRRGLTVVIALLLTATTYGISDVALAKTTDASDLWWVPTESGWGIQLVEEETTIFATIYVYGPDDKPTWYTALMSHQGAGTFTWSGTLNATTGPWFGAVPYNPGQVTVTPVGVMTFVLTTVGRGTLTYSVNGTNIVKQIERFTLVNQDFSGTYAGTLSLKGNGLPCPPALDTPGTPATFKITQSGSAVTIVSQTSTDTCTVNGGYGQFGHFGDVNGSYTCASGDSGTAAVFEMAISFYEFRARTTTTSVTGCVTKGYVDGLNQPPPAQ